MAKSIVSVKHKVDNADNAWRQQAIIFSFIVSLFLLVFGHTIWLLIPLGVITVIGVSNSLTADGEVTFDFASRQIRVMAKGVLIMNSTFSSSKCFWTYHHQDLGLQRSEGEPKQAVTLHTQLQCIITLSDGKRIKLIQDLYPWQETPAKWQYGEDEKGEFSLVLYVNRRLNTVREACLTHVRE